jgi:predicted nuclease with TOPRIM domain
MANMIDFGLVALVVVQVILAGLCLHAFSRINGEIKELGDVKLRITQVTTLANDAMAAVKSVEVEHYKGLVNKLDGIQDDIRTLKKDQAGLDEKFHSLTHKYAALRRWTEPAKDPAADEKTAPVPPNLFSPQPQTAPPKSNFGRRAA